MTFLLFENLFSQCASQFRVIMLVGSVKCLGFATNALGIEDANSRLSFTNGWEPETRIRVFHISRGIL